jgi:prefoldin subunit 5
MGLFQVIGQIIKELHRQWEGFMTLGDPQQRREDELRVMYGAGLLDSKQFFEMLGKLRQGLIGQGDLAILRRATAHKNTQPGAGLARYTAEVHRGLERVYINRARLAELRRDLHQALQVLGTEIDQIQRQADKTGGLAKQALPDEGEARALLETKFRLEERVSSLRARQASLRSGMHRLDAMQGEVNGYEAELKALAVEEKLAEMEGSLRLARRL